jgi:hypothetical protein
MKLYKEMGGKKVIVDLPEALAIKMLNTHATYSVIKDTEEKKEPKEEVKEEVKEAPIQVATKPAVRRR